VELEALVLLALNEVGDGILVAADIVADLSVRSY
jgi:hypothetical protein